MSSTATTTKVNTSLSTTIEPEAYGQIRYVPAGHTPTPSPHNFHLPAISEFGDVRMMPLHDMRPLPSVKQLPTCREGAAQISTHGFTAVRHPSAMHTAPYSLSSWKSPELLQQIYIPETEEMVKQITGAKTVVTEALLLRSAIWSEEDGLATHAGHGQDKTEEEKQEGVVSAASSPAAADQDDEETDMNMPQFIGFSPSTGSVSPAPKVHLDYAPDGARTHIRRYHPDLKSAATEIIAAEDHLTSNNLCLKEHYALQPNDHPRWSLFSVWRPLKRVKRDPLALGDARTFIEDDYVPVDVRAPCLGVPGKETHMVPSYLGRWSPAQKWYWVSAQEPEEVLIIGLFDSQRENDSVASGGTLHSSVDIPGTENEEARESIELRCLAIW